MIVTSMQLTISSRRDIAVLQKESPSFNGGEDVKNSLVSRNNGATRDGLGPPKRVRLEDGSADSYL